MLEEVDPLAWVKRNPRLFFPDGVIDPIRLLAYVMSDVVELGRGECRIVQRDRWWFVSSDVDWLAHDLSLRELFQRVVTAQDHGEHSMRAEVLIHGYARDVLAISRGEECLIAGTKPEQHLIEATLHGNWARALIAFRL